MGRTWIMGRSLVSVLKVVLAASVLAPTVQAQDYYRNLTTLDGVAAPRCAELCFPFNPEAFEDNEVPCQEFEGDMDKWVPCLCTDRPFMRYIADCIFQKCGPAIPSAIDYGYNVCADYDIKLPAPADAIEQLNITVPNEAIGIPTKISNMTGPFATRLPDLEEGASDSDEDPGVNRILEMNKTATSDSAPRQASLFSSKDKSLLSVAVPLLWCGAIAITGSLTHAF